ncbi:MAG TPA: adenylosuccinate synthetase, partial [Dehalococcoidales bacterium]|nr:adenylosuccinate synthetase [Dehalococcoidales bacterium]
NGYTQAAITRLDVLDTQPALKICTGYEVDGKIIDNFPASASLLEKCRPVYEELPGWQTPISDIRDFAQLPPQARQYLSQLEELIACPISIISVGMRREQTIFKRPIL